MMKQKILYIMPYILWYLLLQMADKRSPPPSEKSAGAHFRSKTLIFFADLLSMYDVLNKSQTYVRLHLEFVWRS